MRVLSPRLGLCFFLSAAACGSQTPAGTTQNPKDIKAVSTEAPLPSAEERAKALDAIYAEHFEAYLKLHPGLAQSMGDARYNHVFPEDISAEVMAAQKALASDARAKVAAVSEQGLSEAERIRRAFFLDLRDMELASFEVPNHLLPVNQFHSLALHFAQIGSGEGTHPFNTEKDYRDFLQQAQGFSAWVDTAIERMREGSAQGIVLPKVLIEKTLPQLESQFKVKTVKQSLFYAPLAKLPESITGEARDALVKDYEASIREVILPAYQRLHAYMSKEYLAKGVETDGLGALPGGAEWYQAWIRYHTTTELSADEIHELGLAEVKRILEEMEGVRQQVGFKGDLKKFFAHLTSEPKYFFKKKSDLVQGYASLKDRIDALLPTFFDVMPKTPYEVRPVEAFREQSAAGASYQQGSADGTRPGIFYINTFNLKAQPKWGMETLSLHEAAPGHHFQISLQQEMQGVPSFQRFSDNTAYVEGWALYAESIGKEMGLFTDPYQYFGRLSDEMLRAMRLVVDTGLHAKGWSREQAIQYMVDNSALAKSDIVAEVERYMAIPGQALAYKVGQLTITKLRAEAEAAMGERFDVRAFHNQVLGDGALPLGILSDKIRRWAGVLASE